MRSSSRSLHTVQDSVLLIRRIGAALHRAQDRLAQSETRLSATLTILLETAASDGAGIALKATSHFPRSPYAASSPAHRNPRRADTSSRMSPMRVRDAAPAAANA
jgi:hypothetical protein